MFGHARCFTFTLVGDTIRIDDRGAQPNASGHVISAALTSQSVLNIGDNGVARLPHGMDVLSTWNDTGGHQSLDVRLRRTRPFRGTLLVIDGAFKLSPRAVYAYFKEIGDNTPIDVTLYNIPMFASPIDVPTIQRLADECPRVTGIKDSSGDIPNMIRMIQAVRPNRPDFSFLTGWDAALMPMLLVGCDGGTNASSGVVPELTRKLYDLTTSYRIDEARELQYDIVTLFDAMLYSAEFPDGFRTAVRLRGFDTGVGRQPLSDEQQTDLATLANKLQCMLSEHGFTDEPLCGCPLPAGAKGSSPEEVATIVQAVVAELTRRGLA